MGPAGRERGKRETSSGYAGAGVVETPRRRGWVVYQGGGGGERSARTQLVAGRNAADQRHCPADRGGPRERPAHDGRRDVWRGGALRGSSRPAQSPTSTPATTAIILHVALESGGARVLRCRLFARFSSPKDRSRLGALIPSTLFTLCGGGPSEGRAPEHPPRQCERQRASPRYVHVCVFAPTAARPPPPPPHRRC